MPLGVSRLGSGITVIGVLGVMVQGCVPLPATTFETAPRYSAEQISAISHQPQTRQSLLSELGPPDLRRNADRLWIYTWTDDLGAWEMVPVQGNWSDNRFGSVESYRHLWTFEFSEDGALANQEYAADEKVRRDGAYCSTRGVCLHHPLMVDDGELGVRETFNDLYSAVTNPVATDLPEAGPTPQSRGCTVTVWPEEVANIKQGTGWLRGGFSLRIEGSESWSSWRWVPYPSAYAQIVLPPGDQLLEIKYDVDRGRTDRTSGHVVQCLPGEFLYLAVAASSATLDNGSVEWRVVEADRATQEMAGKACVIPPDATGDAPAQPAISIG